MGITDVVKGCKDKASALRALVERHRLTWDEVCFMGDDVNDLPALALAGLAAAPADARPAVLRQVHFVAARRGGDGAVREILDAILTAREASSTIPKP
jgi:3-deoxy-D-manno-octulosonate 8-phosphate phosphatase (KDO 8-P phosphatase)